MLTPNCACHILCLIFSSHLSSTGTMNETLDSQLNTSLFQEPFNSVLVSDYRALREEYDTVVVNLRAASKSFLPAYTLLYIVLGLIGNCLIVWVISREKDFASLFYRLLSLDAVLSNLVLIGQGFLLGYNSRLWCTTAGFVKHCGGNVASWLAMLLWKPLAYGVTEVNAILSLIIGIDRVVSLYFPIWYIQKMKNTKRSFPLICLFLVTIYFGLYMPHFVRFTPRIEFVNGTGALNLIAGHRPEWSTGWDRLLSKYVNPWKTLTQVLGCIVLNVLVVFKIQKQSKNVAGDTDRDKERLAKSKASVRLMIITTVFTGLQNLAYGIFLLIIFFYNCCMSPAYLQNPDSTLGDIRFFYFVFDYSVYILSFVKNAFFFSYGINFYVMFVFVGSFRRAVYKHVLCRKSAIGPEPTPKAKATGAK